MKKNLLLSLFLILGSFQLNAQAIFDASIHTAIGYGDVNSPFNEGPQQALDQDPMTKFLDFNIADGMGFDVDLLGELKTASSIQIVTANDAPERDPTDYEILGSTDGTNYTSIATGTIPCVAERFLSRSFGFNNSTAYSFYRVNFTGTCGTSMIIQVADVQLYETVGNAPEIICPPSMEVGSTSGLCGGIAVFDVTATDVEDGMLTPALSSGLPSGSVFPLGTSAVVYSVTDSDNNTVSCDVSITVHDTENPVFECPGDTLVPLANPSDMSAVVTYEMIFSDNCSAINPLEGYTALGTIEGKSYYLSDSLFTGPEAFADAALQGGMVATIRSEADNQYLLDAILRNNNGIANVLIGLNDLLIEGTFLWANDDVPDFTNWNDGEPNNAGLGGAPENYTIILTTGLWNDVDTTVARRYLLEKDFELLQTQGLASGSEFPIGATTNTFELYDAAGNATICEFTITVDDQVDVLDPELDKSIFISPNPVQNVMNLQNKFGLELESISIYNSYGEEVELIKIGDSRQQVSIDIADLATGFYLIKINGKEGIATKKITKF